jgi:hypothetical protein
VSVSELRIGEQLFALFPDRLAQYQGLGEDEDLLAVAVNGGISRPRAGVFANAKNLALIRATRWAT